MEDFTIDRRFVLVFRLLMGWVFLYAGLSQVLSPRFHDHPVPGAHENVSCALRTADLAGNRSLSDVRGQLGPSADRAVAGVRSAGTRQRPLRRGVDADLLDCAHGLSLYRKPCEFADRLSHRLCRSDHLAGGCQRRACFRARWMGGPEDRGGASDRAHAASRKLKRSHPQSTRCSPDNSGLLLLCQAACFTFRNRASGPS